MRKPHGWEQLEENERDHGVVEGPLYHHWGRCIAAVYEARGSREELEKGCRLAGRVAAHYWNELEA